jgi:hypothetical protein
MALSKAAIGIIVLIATQVIILNATMKFVMPQFWPIGEEHRGA